MTYEIGTRTLPAQATAVARGSVPVEQIGAWLSETYREIATYLESVGMAPAGPPFARYTFHDAGFDVEAGFPVAKPPQPHGRMTPSSLPAGPAAVTTYYGPYDKIEAAYEAINTWLTAHGHKADGPHWEIYFTDPQAEPDPARWRTDLVAPYVEG
jgi:effector-binding domain-containing protein